MTKGLFLTHSGLSISTLIVALQAAISWEDSFWLVTLLTFIAYRWAGMHTGIQDAFNLAWKIAFTLQQKTSSHILGSYHEKRHSVAKALLKRTEAGTRIVALKKN